MGLKAAYGLGDALFGGVQQRVLAVLFGTPDRSFYSNELLRLTGSGKGALQRELGRLEQAGLVTARKIGNQKHYQANPQAPVFEELRGIVLKTFGVADVLRQALLPLAERIEAAFIYGSVARRTDTSRSDIDLFVVSEDAGYQGLIEALLPLEKRLGRKISPTIYSPSELERKRAERSGFLGRVLEGPKIFLIGGERDLG
jgi:predicted nucleotidyltransferase